MLDLLIVASHGAENATRASLPFFLAKAAKEKGKRVAIALAADAAPIAQSAVRDQIQGLGMAPLAELYGFAQAQGIPIYI